ncbi:DUF3397 family protein [Streptococcus sp. DD12]|uniref:DUF3397 family protein n=1 Tax=Streptococcus sp. DD12 TaxID=1777880 RepID=UPI00079B4485|nr:DUF3397 family protein [Streptococcus sp. DD12]KXT76035.1 hypothetical protein STRDD12_01147 [Streptococcus sp. DD12]
MIYKILAVALLFITPFFAVILTKLFGLRKRGLLFTDLALVFYAVEAVWLSSLFFTHLILPAYLLLLALLAIGVTFFLLFRSKKAFGYKRFFKLFWRLGFLATLAFYLVELALIFLTA